MSSLEGNKIAAAILVGGMITLSVGIITDFIYRPGGHGAEAAHEGGEPAAKPGAAPLEPVLGLIASADVAKGAELSKKCTTCHSFDASGANKVGPGLYGVIGRAAGAHPDFAYSEPMKAHAKPWTFADLNHFIARPKEFIPGTKMTFPGLPKAQDRADLFAWMAQQSASPAPMPTPEEIAAEEAALKPAEGAAPAEGEAAAPAEGEQAATQVEEPAAQGQQPAAPAGGEQPAAAGGDNAVAMVASADPAKGEKVAAKCKACHDLTNAAKNKVGPALWGIVGRNHAAIDGFAYSDAMKGMSGKPWTFEDLDHFLAKPKDYAPGTKMAFPGLPKAEDRAALLRWLNDQSDSPAPLPQ